MNARPNPDRIAPLPKLMTFAEAAAHASNSVAWWRKLAARRGITTVKLGRSVRVLEADVGRIVRDGVRSAREP
jgi:hypothetical protein